MPGYLQALKAALQALKSIGMDGVVVEIWWGNVEGSAPHAYDWSTYDAIFKMLSSVDLRGQVRSTICQSCRRSDSPVTAHTSSRAQLDAHFEDAVTPS